VLPGARQPFHKDPGHRAGNCSLRGGRLLADRPAARAGRSVHQDHRQAIAAVANETAATCRDSPCWLTSPGPEADHGDRLRPSARPTTARTAPASSRPRARGHHLPAELGSPPEEKAPILVTRRANAVAGTASARRSLGSADLYRMILLMRGCRDCAHGPAGLVDDLRSGFRSLPGLLSAAVSWDSRPAGLLSREIELVRKSTHWLLGSGAAGEAHTGAEGRRVKFSQVGHASSAIVACGRSGVLQ